MLKKLLDQGIFYAFISNSDNLGARLDESLLGYFAKHQFPFMMEVASCGKPLNAPKTNWMHFRTSVATAISIPITSGSI